MTVGVVIFGRATLVVTGEAEVVPSGGGGVAASFATLSLAGLDSGSVFAWRRGGQPWVTDASVNWGAVPREVVDRMARPSEAALNDLSVTRFA